MTREEYLIEIIEAARPLFTAVEYPLPANVRASIGPPGGKRIDGVCYHSICSADSGREIFVNPQIIEPLRIAGVLVHELCHSALADGIGHKSPFTRLARLMQLEGKPTHTTEGEAFFAIWKPIIEALGPYPGIGFDPSQRIGGPKQTARMIKASCAGCGFVFRTAQKWIDDSGRLQCPRFMCSGEILIG